MKKAISIMLAVATLAFATSALADTTSTGNVENKTANKTFAASPEDTDSMPCFEQGDTVEFTISGAKEGDDITLLSFKNGEEVEDTTVQYIDQYVATGSTQDVIYTIRDLADGVYNLKIKVEDNELYTVYYMVGDVSSDVTYGDVNGDGEVTALDVTVLARNLAGWKDYGTIDATQADVNADSKVNALDNTILARHVAKWSGYTTLPYASK